MTPSETNIVKKGFTVVAGITLITAVLWLTSILTTNDALKTLSISYILVGMAGLGWKSIKNKEEV